MDLKWISLSGVIVAAVLLATRPVLAADASNGERLARQWCASCHLVARDQNGPTTEAPPFSAIAKRSDLDAGKIARFLLDPHPRMPNMSLTRIEAGDLAAYIETQK